jgi:hypothetical protein
MSKPIRFDVYYKKKDRMGKVPNIVRVLKAGIESNAPYVNWFIVYWVTKDGKGEMAHVCAKDEFEAWHKMNKHFEGDKDE